MYTAELSHIIARHGLQFHQYADWCAVRSTVRRRRLLDLRLITSTAQQFSRCLHDVEAWMSASRLRLNPSKTVVLWLGSRHVIDKLDVHEVQVLSLISTVKIDSSARDLGVVVDSRLTMSDHVASVCRSAYYYLRQIRPIVQSLKSMPLGRWSRRSLSVVWTTATQYCTAPLTIFYNVCSLFRMPPRGWSLAQDDVNISHPFYVNYTCLLYTSDAADVLRV